MAIVHKPIADAVEDVAQRLSISIAAAKAKVIEACHNGLIRAYWRGHYSGQCPFIPRTEWAGADIDVKCQVVIGAKERMAFVDLDEKDCAAWLNSLAAPDQPARSNGGHKNNLVRAAAASIFGKDGPPPMLPPQEVFKKVADRVQRDHGVAVSKTTVRRALRLR
jgi:hypothetical protein